MILPYYLGKGTDHRGRRIDDVWGFTDQQLEETHDFIQWLFPLLEPSVMVPGSPTLTSDDAQKFRASPLLQERLGRSLRTMLRFYGLERMGNEIRAARGFDERGRSWLVANGHNLLRVTRMLKSLTLLGRADLACELYGCLRDISRRYPAVTDHTLAYWREATEVSRSDV